MYCMCSDKKYNQQEPPAFRYFQLHKSGRAETASQTRRVGDLENQLITVSFTCEDLEDTLKSYLLC